MKFNKLFQYIAENTEESTCSVFVNCGISTQILYSMKNPGKTIGKRKCGVVNLKTIDKLCSYLHCQPSDIMELD